MISPDYVLMMARYNAWQNKQMIAAFKALSAEELEVDRGGFFGSIRKTASHLLWGDMMWMARFDGSVPPEGGIGESTEMVQTREDWALARFRVDARILQWAEAVRAVDLTGSLSWYSGAAGQNMIRPFALCVVHMFNHQTHHRGQIHAMLTTTDVAAPVTDLALMPVEGPWL